MVAQQAVMGDMVKATVVPQQVDGQIIYDLIAEGKDWEQVFDLYPSNFYIDA